MIIEMKIEINEKVKRQRVKKLEEKLKNLKNM